MASLYPKKVGGKTYWYLREMGRVDGKPKMISERYLGSAADIAAAMEAREAAARPERTRHPAFGAVAAAWGLLEELGGAAGIDGETIDVIVAYGEERMLAELRDLLAGGRYRPPPGRRGAAEPRPGGNSGGRGAGRCAPGDAPRAWGGAAQAGAETHKPKRKPATLVATVADPLTISLTKRGRRVTALKAGTYVILVRDRASDHNFHLTGPGVDKVTSIGGKGTFRWAVKLAQGSYDYVCDQHASFMQGGLPVP